MSRRRVYGWVADHSGCGYYRVEMPLANLPKDRWDATWATVLPIHWHEDAAVVVGQRVCKPGPTKMWRNVCANPDVLAVYEVDDDLLNVDPTSNSWATFKDDEIRENIRRNIAMADLVTVSTEPLADRIRQMNRNVAVVPNYIAAETLTYASPYDPSEVTVGWTGSATHDMDWLLVKDTIRRLLNQRPEMRVHFIGASYPGLPPANVRWTRWMDDVQMYLRAVGKFFDVGIAPLRPHLFNQTKSHLKALEYAALGIPAVVSAGPSYNGFVQHAETGFLVRREHEWARWLRALLADAAMRQEMGTKARLFAEQWTIEENITHWETALGGEF